MKQKMTIAVPTDFSTASRAGMRFALQWARQQNSHLLFFHVLNMIRLTGWSDKQFQVFSRAQRSFMGRRLHRIVQDVVRRYDIPRKSFSEMVVDGMGVDLAVNDLRRAQRKVDLICMGTRGAGKLRKLFGTNTGNTILHADLPVIAVPAGYRAKPINRILYATDLQDYRNELATVAAITRPLHPQIMVLHLREEGEPVVDPELISKGWREEYGLPVDLVTEMADPTRSVSGNLRQAVKKFKPSLLVMFTDRKRTFFQRVFYPSQTERMAFQLDVPLLVMAKRQ